MMHITNEHCPDWAKEVWEERVCTIPRSHLYKGLWDIDDSWSMVSQLVSEWLELNQIETYDTPELTELDYNISGKKIKFFSDEV